MGGETEPHWLGGFSICERGACSRSATVAPDQHYCSHLGARASLRAAVKKPVMEALLSEARAKLRDKPDILSFCSPRWLPEGKSTILRFCLVSCVSLTLSAPEKLVYLLSAGVPCKHRPPESARHRSREASVCIRSIQCVSERRCRKRNVPVGYELLLVVSGFSGLTPMGTVSPTVMSKSSGLGLPAFDLSSLTASLGQVTFCINLACNWGGGGGREGGGRHTVSSLQSCCEGSEATVRVNMLVMRLVCSKHSINVKSMRNGKHH